MQTTANRNRQGIRQPWLAVAVYPEPATDTGDEQDHRFGA